MEEATAFKVEERKCYRCNNKGHMAHACKMVLSTRKGNKVKSYNCNKVGHMQKDCRASPKKFCKICKKTNHTENNCFSRSKSNKVIEEENSNVVFLTGANKNHRWIIDSGSTSQMTNNANILKNQRSIKMKIGVANKEGSMIAKSAGTVFLSNCKLEKVLYVPDLKANLLSVNAITKKGGIVQFNDDKVTVHVKGNNVLEGKRNSEGFYVIEKDQMSESVFITNDDHDVETWHKRLGHLGAENMIKLLNISDGMKLNKNEITKQLKNCKTCIEANHVRIPFKTQRRRATRPLEIIHSDVCGPITPSPWDGMKYFITFIDDFTNYTKVYLMKVKGEAVNKIKEFIKQMEVKWERYVSELRCDNGLEYASNEFKAWCKIKSIFVNYTTPHTPQLNGKAERLNRTLVEKTRAMLGGTNNNKALWNEAVRVASYLYNRSPTKANDRTAYEMWNGQKPNLKNIKIFGCTAYTKKFGQLRKLDERSKAMKFVGYAPVGYRLWDSERRKIVISRDVHFVKNDEEQTVTQNETINFDENGDDETVTDDSDLEDNASDNSESNTETTDDESKEEDITIREENRPSPSASSTPRRPITQKKFPEKYKDFAYLMYDEAMNSDNKSKWERAIRNEMNSHKKNKTWEMVDARKIKGKKCISSRWVFQVKSDGRYKARLVARGCEQGKYIDYEELFSPMVSNAALRMLFAMAAHNNWQFMSFDVKTAFLYGELKEEIYMKPPAGYKSMENKIFKLKKSIYGLRQASN